MRIRQGNHACLVRGVYHLPAHSMTSRRQSKAARSFVGCAAPFASEGSKSYFPCLGAGDRAIAQAPVSRDGIGWPASDLLGGRAQGKTTTLAIPRHAQRGWVSNAIGQNNPLAPCWPSDSTARVRSQAAHKRVHNTLRGVLVLRRLHPARGVESVLWHAASVVTVS